MTTMKASPAKLRDGSWGARVSGAVSIGDVVTITTKAGKSWDATVTRVVWTDGTAAICATASNSPRPSTSRSSRYAGYQRRIDRAGDASTCNCRMCQSGSECLCERDWM
jgi:hypothetical protein